MDIIQKFPKLEKIIGRIKYKLKKDYYKRIKIDYDTLPPQDTSYKNVNWEDLDSENYL